MKTSRADPPGVSTADNQKSDTHAPNLTSAHKAIPTRLKARPLGIDTSEFGISCPMLVLIHRSTITVSCVHRKRFGPLTDYTSTHHLG